MGNGEDLVSFGLHCRALAMDSHQFQNEGSVGWTAWKGEGAGEESVVDSQQQRAQRAGVRDQLSHIIQFYRFGKVASD